MKPRVFVTRRWPQEVERILEERFDVTLNLDDRPLGDDEIAEAFLAYDAILPTVSDRLPAALFRHPRTRTRIIGNFGVGYNHIDIEAARQAGIAVTNTPGVLTDCTADLTLALMLMVSRRAGEGERQLRSGAWQGWSPTHMMGTAMHGKTLGIVGMGRIGKAVARRARFGFGMTINFFNRSRLDDEDTRALGAAQVDSLETLMETCDFVSLHCPGGGGNRNLVNAARLGLMKPTAFLINTARGDVVDEAALIAALQDRTIAGAGLDVYAAEPMVPAELKAMENVVLLPHLGSATRETRIAMGMKVIENIAAFFEGEEPPDRVA
jgi:lactate dehydrogenase-like 2-hydroxyacid dehydrogenase